MGKTTKPVGLPSGNTVDATTLDEDLDIAYVSLSATNVKIDNPPELGESVTYVIHGKCTAVGEKENKDGEIRNVRTITVGSAHRPGKRPVADPAQGSIFSVVTDEDGTRTETEPDDESDESGVESPEFSDTDGGADDAD